MRVRESRDGLEETAGRNTNVKGDSGQVSDENQKSIVGNWGKVILINEVSENLAELCSCVSGKVGLAHGCIEYLSEETFKRGADGAAWCLSPAYSTV